MPFLSVSALSGLRITKHWAGSPLPEQEAQNVGRLGPPCRTGRLTAPAAQLRDCCLLATPTASLKVTLPSWGDLQPRTGPGRV